MEMDQPAMWMPMRLALPSQLARERKSSRRAPEYRPWASYGVLYKARRSDQRQDGMYSPLARSGSSRGRVLVVRTVRGFLMYTI